MLCNSTLLSADDLLSLVSFVQNYHPNQDVKDRGVGYIFILLSQLYRWEVNQIINDFHLLLPHLNDLQRKVGYM